MPLTIYIEENIPFLSESLQNCGKIVRFSGRKLTNADLVNSGCQALFVRSTTKVDENLLTGTKVVFLGSSTSGIDHVDTEYLKKNRIKFSHALGTNANSVAEYVIFSILKWLERSSKYVENTTIGIIGFGNIGRLVAKYSHFLGFKLNVNDPPLKDDYYIFPEYVNYLGLEDLLKTSDVITNHVPLTISGKYPTNNFLNREMISQIKHDSLFIHTSRGGIVSEDALLSKIENFAMQAVVDVWEGEPLIDAFLARECLLATPHIAGYSFDGKLRGALKMADEFGYYFGLNPNIDNLIAELADYKSMDLSEFRNYSKLLDLLNDSRNLNQDHEKLLNSLLLSDIERKRAFDLMRKNYPRRREIL